MLRRSGLAKIHAELPATVLPAKRMSALRMHLEKRAGSLFCSGEWRAIQNNTANSYVIEITT
jgi:hypothetical protein